MGIAGRDVPVEAACQSAEFVPQRDDGVEFARGFEDCRPHLMRLCRRILGRADGTEDAVHDTYLLAYGSWSRFDGGNLAGWLSRIAQHVCIDQIRTGLRVRPLDEGNEPAAADDEMRFLTAIQIRDILRELPERQRQCLKLFYIEGFSAKEVAKATGFTEKQVKSYLQNGRRSFILEWEALKKKS